MSDFSSHIGQWIDIPDFVDERGSLFVIEGTKHIPFPIKRVYWMKDVPTSASRGGQCHKRLRQVLVPIQGSFLVELDDGEAVATYTMDNPQKGLLIEPLIWRTLHDFSGDAICLVIASELYDHEDMINDYSVFKKQLHE